MEYFLIRCIYGNEEVYSIWYTGDVDGLMQINRKILCFTNVDSAVNYVNGMLLTCDIGAIATYDLDDLKRWLNSESDEIDCKKVLDMWNLFTDMAATVNQQYRGNRKDKTTNLLYDKLFYGCNFPGIKPENEDEYIPFWNDKQIKLLKAILDQGLNLYVSNRAYNPIV